MSSAQFSIKAIRQEGQWFAHVSDGRIYGTGFGHTYLHAIDAALVNLQQKHPDSDGQTDLQTKRLPRIVH
jgi:hypothetical protein